MEHFEDLLFESWGFELLEKFKSNDVEYTRKWDGAPSIFFGKDEGGYWIARKGIFNKIPLNITSDPTSMMILSFLKI